jgi:hypothetical protein
VLLLLLQKAPIVVEVVKQPPATPSISYGSVLLSAVALVGVILLASLLVGVRGRRHLHLPEEALQPLGPTDGSRTRKTANLSRHVVTSVRLWDCSSAIGQIRRSQRPQTTGLLTEPLVHTMLPDAGMLPR